jgi:hypothetical protein
LFKEEENFVVVEERQVVFSPCMFYFCHI